MENNNNSVETIHDTKVVTTSLEVARKFGKTHDSVLRDIQDVRDSLKEYGIPDFDDYEDIYIRGPKGEKIKAIELSEFGHMHFLNCMDYRIRNPPPVLIEIALEFLDRFRTLDSHPK